MLETSTEEGVSMAATAGAADAAASNAAFSSLESSSMAPSSRCNLRAKPPSTTASKSKRLSLGPASFSRLIRSSTSCGHEYDGPRRNEQERQQHGAGCHISERRSRIRIPGRVAGCGSDALRSLMHHHEYAKPVVKAGLLVA